MNIKVFVITFVIVYVLISLPGILGIGYVIDWVPGTSTFQKLKGCLIEGITHNFIIKIVLACIVGIFITLIVSMRKQSKRNTSL